MPAPGRPRDQQVREVGASNQQREGDDAHQQQHEPLDRLGGFTAQRSGLHRRQAQARESLVVARRVELPVERIDRRRGLLTRDAVAQSADDVQPHEFPRLEDGRVVEEASADGSRRSNRHVEAGRGPKHDASKARLGHADNGDGLLVNPQQSADHGRVRAETRAPVVVAEHGNDGTVTDIVRRQQDASGRGADAEDLKRVARHEHRGGELRAVVHRDAEAPAPGPRHGSAEHIASCCVCEVIRICGGPCPAHQPFRLLHVHGTQQRRVRQAEHRRVGADAKGEGEHRRKGEARLLDEKARGVTHITDDVLHDASSGTTGRLQAEAEPLACAGLHQIEEEPRARDLAASGGRACDLKELATVRAPERRR